VEALSMMIDSNSPMLCRASALMHSRKKTPELYATMITDAQGEVAAILHPPFACIGQAFAY
jgi:hypothetical protein